MARRYPFRWPRMLKALGPDLGAEVTWEVSDPPVRGQLAELFDTVSGVQKMPHYLPVYEANLPRERPIRMLEIGVARGGSLCMWRKWLHPESVILGIDIDPNCKQFDDPDNQVHVRIGGQQDTEFLQSVIDEFGPFDVVLDDGSHMASHMVESFRYLFPHLKPGGVYLVEDIHADYWTFHRDRSTSFVDFVKSLIDAMHAHYLSMESERSFREGDPARLPRVQVPKAAVITEKVEFYDSIAVIHRADRALPRSVYR